MTYHNTLRFGCELVWIYEHLLASPSISAVWRVVSGIPQDNGICFCWQNKRFRINWYKGHWYIAAQTPFFWTDTLEEVIRFCMAMTNIKAN